jgi:hypothetical protein
MLGDMAKEIDQLKSDMSSTPSLDSFKEKLDTLK